jgi:hypothetical protein
MSYTLAAAAAVLRAIKAGKISRTKDEQGEWHVEPAELHRVYPPIAAAPERTDAMQRDATLDAAAFLRRVAEALQGRDFGDGDVHRAPPHHHGTRKAAAAG